MLLRADGDGVLAIGQPSHAWVSGQLARAWGNARFGDVYPREEVCLAAEQHDIGMAAWDLEPSFNPATGLPHGFIEMPLEVHAELWRGAARRLLRQSRYAALLTSMHGVRLYELRDLDRLPAAQATIVRELIAEQRDFQVEITRSLQADPATAEHSTAALIARASDLLWTWDGISLAVCLGWAPWTAEHVPAAGQDTRTDVRLVPSLTRPHDIHVDPWPFSSATVTLRCEGQRLHGPYADPDELAAALRTAPWESLVLRLLPG